MISAYSAVNKPQQVKLAPESPPPSKMKKANNMANNMAKNLVGFGRGYATGQKKEEKKVDPDEAPRKLADRLRPRLVRFAPHAPKAMLENAAAWRVFKEPKALPPKPSGTDESKDREALNELRLVEPTAKVDGPVGQPHMTNLTAPKYDGITKMAQLVDGEMAPQDVVEAAQASYDAHTWVDAATLAYLKYA
eukprot:6398838-Prymnesium_polylepis.1